MKNYVVMTVKGRKDLTWVCLKGLDSEAKDIEKIITVDAGFVGEALYFGVDDVLGSNQKWIYLHRLNCNISEGWNIGIQYFIDAERIVADDSAIWLLNNDVTFRKRGWLKLLHDRLQVEGTGMIGAYGMSLFGHSFVTGGVWGFRLDAALKVVENGKVLDERFNYSCQDVDLSVRIANAGYVVTHVPGIEYGDDPYLVHGISQTVLSHEDERTVFKKREPERRLIIDKHGRKDDKEGYEGVVEVE